MSPYGGGGLFHLLKCAQPLLLSSCNGPEYGPIETRRAVSLPPAMFDKASAPPPFFLQPHQHISRSPEKVLCVCSVNMPEDLFTEEILERSEKRRPATALDKTGINYFAYIPRAHPLGTN